MTFALRVLYYTIIVIHSVRLFRRYNDFLACDGVQIAFTLLSPSFFTLSSNDWNMIFNKLMVIVMTQW